MASTVDYTRNSSNDVNSSVPKPPELIPVELTVTIYSAIFILAVVGNGLVILTLVQNRRMRTVTNVFLLNLAISDLLLAVFCMPFTLIPILIKNFVFGPIMCVSIRYAQGVSVGTSCFTLVAISLERYFAICRPLHSRRWQTRSHSYKIIAACWISSLVIVIPIAISTKHVELRPGLNQCREFWPSEALERAYTIFLDVVLLLVPLCLMTGAYAKIMTTLCVGMASDDQHNTAYQNGNQQKQTIVEMLSMKTSAVRSHVLRKNRDQSANNRSLDRNYLSMQMRDLAACESSPCSSEESTPRKKLDHTRIIRQSNYEKNRTAKLRVVRMLFIVVVEFFVCWTPLYTLQTWRSFHQQSMMESISSVTWSAMFLLSYLSSCCNPITYCFMNRRFRQSFMAALRCCKRKYPYTTYAFSKNGTSTRRTTWMDRVDDSDPSSEGRMLNSVVIP